MSLHPGMIFVFTKGKSKRRKGTVIAVNGNEILIKTSKRQYWTNKNNLDNRVNWL